MGHCPVSLAGGVVMSDEFLSQAWRYDTKALRSFEWDTSFFDTQIPLQSNCNHSSIGLYQVEYSGPCDERPPDMRPNLSHVTLVLAKQYFLYILHPNIRPHTHERPPCDCRRGGISLQGPLYLCWASRRFHERTECTRRSLISLISSHQPTLTCLTGLRFPHS